MTEEPVPISYLALKRGTPVRSRDGERFGTVEHVLEIPDQQGIFDGIVVATDDGLRYVERDAVETITAAYVTCALTREQAAQLPPPDGDDVFTVDALDDTGDSLSDKLGRLFGRGHWHREH